MAGKDYHISLWPSPRDLQVTTMPHGSEGQQQPTTKYATATAHTRQRCFIPYLRYYDPGIEAYTHSTVMENGLDDVYQKGSG